MIDAWNVSGFEPATTGDETAQTVAPAVVRGSAADRSVFIVYGHDIGVRDGLELLLRRMGMEPIVLQNLPRRKIFTRQGHTEHGLDSDRLGME
jgi:predicted nucleotide-binding protein